MLDLAFLDDLTDADRRELHARLAFELGKPGRKIDIDGRMRAMHDAICAALGEKFHSLANYLEKANKTSYMEAVETFEGVLNKALPQFTRRPVRDAVAETAMRCLVARLKRFNIPVNFGTMVTNMSRLEVAVNTHFPGYIDAQLLHKVVKIAT